MPSRPNQVSAPLSSSRDASTAITPTATYTDVGALGVSAAAGGVLGTPPAWQTVLSGENIVGDESGCRRADEDRA